MENEMETHFSIPAWRVLQTEVLLPSIFPSIRGFSSESALHIRWPKYWSFHFDFVTPWTTLTQGSNPGLPHCRQILYQLSSQHNLALPPSINN